MISDEERREVASSCGWQSGVWHQYSYCPDCGAKLGEVECDG